VTGGAGQQLCCGGWHVELLACPAGAIHNCCRCSKPLPMLCWPGCTRSKETAHVQHLQLTAGFAVRGYKALAHPFVRKGSTIHCINYALPTFHPT
jgi:hypothetical protein